MNGSTNHGAAVRSRATRRLRTLTIGTTMAGLAASAGFGWLAAATYDGTESSVTAVLDTTQQTSDSAVTTPTPTPSTAPAPTTSSHTTGSSSGLRSSSGRAQVSTGGS